MQSSQSVSREPASTAAKAPHAELDQVREILFGAWSREVNERFEQLLRELDSRIAAMKADADRRFMELERFTREELRALTDRLTEEGQAREVASSEMDRSIQELGETFRGRMDEWVKVSEHHWDQLRAAKADRDDLAALLRGVAEKIAAAPPSQTKTAAE